MPRMARFIFASRRVVWFDSCPWMDRFLMAFLPFPLPWASMNFTDWTNMPAEPQQGSKTRPSYGSIISTSSLTTERGV